MTGMTDDAISISRLNKSFGSKHAVQDLDLVIPRGVLYGVIGPNGAGKSTTLRMILSILFPDSGRIRVLGEDSALKAKDRIGYLPEERGVYRKMQVGAFLQHMAILKGVPREQVKARVAKWLERVALPDVAKKRCEELSKGMQQKIQFIAAVIHDPELLILDEPFSGLDPVNMRLLRDLILDQQRGGATVLFSTHAMPQAEQICEHIVMLHGGRKVLDDKLATIRAQHAPTALALEPLATDVDVAARLADLACVAGVARSERHYRVDLREGARLDDAVQAVAARVAPNRLEVVRPTLEDIFVGIVAPGGSTEDGA
jgi:ABC-2 type transport system ATP-binding protein